MGIPPWDLARAIPLPRAMLPRRPAPSTAQASIENAVRMSRDQRDHSVPKAAESVHPIGNPINHSTNRGLRQVRGDRGAPAGDVDGWRREHHARIASVRVVPGCITPVVVVWRAAAALSRVFGVGQDEDPIALVTGAHVVRSEHVPFRIEAERGQLADHAPESGSKETWDVLQKHAAGSHLANHARDVGPQPTRVIGAALLAGETDRLARESRSDQIHDSTPRRAVEGREIVPDRRAIQGRRFHPRHECGRGESVQFNETHGSIGGSDRESAAELEASNPGA
jgi:hypothetical protein